jgi:hypothetical protein
MFKNDPQLQAAILRDLKDIVDEVTLGLLKKLRQSMKDEVYDADTPNWYFRYKDNGGLLGSFFKSPTTINSLTVSSSVDHVPNSMVHNPKRFTHGSNYWTTDDIRPYLVDIIINGKSGGLFGDGFWRRPRNFWQPVIDMLTDGTADKMIEQAFNSRGIKWKRV